MHSVTLLAILLALVATVLGQNNTFETTWRCSSPVDAPLDAKQRKEIRDAFSSFLVSRDMTANGTLRVFMSTTYTYSTDLAATEVTNKYQKAALVETIGEARDYMDSIQRISSFCQQVLSHEIPAGAKSAVKMLHLQEKLGSRNAFNIRAGPNNVCPGQRDGFVVAPCVQFYEISHKSGAPMYKEQLSQLQNQLKKLVYVPMQDIFQSKPKSEL